MCGIVGIISRVESQPLSRALQAMHHRGPDAGAEQLHEVAGWQIRLGHRRLSILDLSNSANQPLADATGQNIIVFNGEIYNYQALRSTFAGRGYKFRTRSDTEVLLAGIEIEGLAFLHKLNGMFAFAVLDKARGRLILARDLLGIKPLYVQRRNDGGLAFASELRALAVATGSNLEPDPGCISEFLLNGFLYEPRSGFVGIDKVPQGCALDIDLGSMDVRLHRYHEPLAVRTPDAPLDAILESQVALEMEADVPVGVFFSGGIDSSALVAAAPRTVEAFFVDYGNGDGGESRQASAVADALQTPLRRVAHREQEATPETILDEFRAVAIGTEEPISDYTYIATRIISRHAREAGFKVMLSGMGGDELFAGYPRYSAIQNWSLLRHLRMPLTMASWWMRRIPEWSKRADRLSWFLNSPDFVQAYTSLVGYFSFEEVSRLTGSPRDGQLYLERIRALLEPVSGESFLRQAMYLDRHGFLSHNLTVTDKASMAESIEVRVPLLCNDLDAYSRTLPDNALLQKRKGKIPLKEYLKKHLPAAFVDHPKVGFNPPLDKRIRLLGRGICHELVGTGPITRYVDPAVTRRWIDNHFDGRGNHTYRIWQLIYLSLWLDLSRREARIIT